MTTKKSVVMKPSNALDANRNYEWSQSALYLQVRTKILDAIRAGEWQAGEAIPLKKNFVSGLVSVLVRCARQSMNSRLRAC